MPAGRVSLRVVAAASTVADVSGAVADHDGVVEAVDGAATSLLVSLSFNHVTLRAKRADPSICHLQVAGADLIAHHDDVRAALPGGMLHLDARTVGGERGFGGLYLSRFVDRATLAGGSARLRSLGVDVLDPHTWALGGDNDITATIAVARANDPKGLLNPGKLPR
jgi:hypothetical protein